MRRPGVNILCKTIVFIPFKGRPPFCKDLVNDKSLFKTLNALSVEDMSSSF